MNTRPSPVLSSLTKPGRKRVKFDPFQLAEGFEVVIVNGKIARENRRLGSAMHGRVLQPEGTAL